MRESTESIAIWAHETFGGAASLFRIACRANEELAELLRAISAGQPTDKIAEEAADTAIVLCRIGHQTGTDILECAGHWLAGRKREGAAAQHAIDANRQMASLLALTLESNGTGLRVTLIQIVGSLINVCHSFGKNLFEEIDRKMEVNHSRTWEKDGTGHGYHKRAG
jgi:hypothetical protein